jgi:non-ribosomal peptide synthetase-like protein
MYNTYGPTETTVIATCARLRAGERVTIGRPIPNYEVHVIDEAGRPAPPGVVGEIAIGGIGLARGYVGRPELTASRFVCCPVRGDGEPVLVYRTGDLGRFDARGALAFVGRADDQVKLRGFRIELGEIEAAILAAPDVAHASVVTREVARSTELVAYVVPRGGGLDAEALRSSLRAALPPYMVPAFLEVMPSLPRLPSGKVDRRALPAPAARGSQRALPETAAPRGRLEATIAGAWREVLAVDAVRRDDDFFRDLGGHSLLVARVVSRLRAAPGLEGLSVLDVYEHPTIERLAAALAKAAPRERPEERARERPASWAFHACGAAQLLALYGLFGLHSLQWLGPYLTFAWLRRAGAPAPTALLAGAGALLAVYPLVLLLAVATKWLVLGRYEPGRYPLWGSYYLRFWIVERVLAMAPTGFLVGSPLLAAYYRLLGARIGAGACLASEDLGAFDVIDIGEDAALGEDASVAGHAIVGGELVIAPIKVGARSVIGARSVLAPGSTMGDDAELGPLSLLPAAATIPAGERWEGSPARRAGDVERTPIPRAGLARRAFGAAAYAVASLLLPAFTVAAVVPGLFALHALRARVGPLYLAASPLVAASFVLLLCLEIVVAKRLLLGRVRPGRYPLDGAFAFRKWVFDRAMGMSLDLLGGLYATLFLNPWLRLLGVRVGRHAEVSTASIGATDLLEVGEGAFVADCVSVGPPRFARGHVELDEVKVGARAFLGNSAVVPGGARVGDDALVGCLTLAPRDAGRGATWFGSPSVLLPQRQQSAAFPEEATYRPTRALVAQRLAIELLRVLLPPSCLVFVTCAVLDATLFLSTRLSTAAMVALFPPMLAAVGAAAALFVVAFKWLVVGRYRAGERPLWCGFVWRNELVTAMHENVADPLWNHLLEGTPFVAWFFRALGARIGRRVYMGTTELTEYDLVTIGDEACLEPDATLQTHLFEDRVMKMSTVHVGARCTVGTDAVVLYDSRLDDGASLAPLSLVMKGETLPAETRWQGSPARRAR